MFYTGAVTGGRPTSLRPKIVSPPPLAGSARSSLTQHRLVAIVGITVYTAGQANRGRSNSAIRALPLIWRSHRGGKPELARETCDQIEERDRLSPMSVRQSRRTSVGVFGLNEERVERRLAAILAADVVGYSRLTGENEAGTPARLRTDPCPT
jgi:hypothetical protein